MDQLKFRIDADSAATLRQWLQYYDSPEIRPRDVIRRPIRTKVCLPLCACCWAAA